MKAAGGDARPYGHSIDYGACAAVYPARRRADPRIAARIDAALAGARTVVNVGAGAGSYEPTDRAVIAIEPSAAMRAERPGQLAPAIDARAEALPLDDGAVDAAMAIATTHHWADQVAGLRELRRVARGPVVVLTFDVEALERYWMVRDYVPEVLDGDRERFLPVSDVAGALGGARIEQVPIPVDCTDGFFEAYWARPEAFLDPGVRLAQSIWPRLPCGVEERAIAALARDLRAGAWDERHGRLRDPAEYEGALRLVVSNGPRRGGEPGRRDRRLRPGSGTSG